MVVPKVFIYLQDLPEAVPGAAPENVGMPQGLPLGQPQAAPSSPKHPQAAPRAAPDDVLARDAVVCDITNTNRGMGSLRNEDEINILR